MTSKFLLLLNILPLVLTAKERIGCSKNRTLLEASGDAVLSVFVDTNHGPYCNISSAKGFQQISTALYVVQTLNKYNYVPGLLLGLKIFDTCHDEMTVYKQALQSAVDVDCVAHYELGVLVPSTYGAILEPLRNYSVLPISTYKEQNLTRPLINVMVHYLSTRFEVIDLVLASSSFPLNHFLDSTKDAGVCVKSYADITELDDNNTEAVIAVIGEKNDIREWIQKAEKLEGPRKTWLVLPLDRSYVDDLLPAGSYVVKTETFDFDDSKESPLSPENFHQIIRSSSVIHSPYLLGIGKAIIELAQVLQDLQKRSCTEESSCVMPRFNPHLRQDIRNTDVYETLRILPKSHSVRCVVAMKSQQELVEVAVYRVEAAKFRVVPEKKVPRMPRLCLKKFAGNCEKCANFQKRTEYHGVMKGITDKGFLKTGNWIPIFLTVMVCGTFACLLILVFIVYRFLLEDVLDGNPTLTIVLILANIFTLQTVLPYCIDDDYFGAENLNSRKIFVTTLAFGMIFSVMLSRSLFLAFSTGSVLTTHINGYLQCLMVFFVYGVQIAVSISYFFMSTAESAVVVRSLTFVALLGYDMFLLTTLFIVSCFISQLPRNYHEGKCFFGTVIGLSIAWAVWITCFILMEPETRDVVVCCGILSTSYLIIVGVLIPRTYYMLTHLAGGTKTFGARFGSIDLGSNARMNTIGRQSRPFCDYVHPNARGSLTNLQVPAVYPNYYGSSSPNAKYLGRCRSPDPRRTPGYNNYGFHSEMREIDSSYVIPRVCIENADSRRDLNEVDLDSKIYAKPRTHRKKMILEERDCIETDVYVEGKLSPVPRGHDEIYPSRGASPKLGQTEATICEEDEEDITRITRF